MKNENKKKDEKFMGNELDFLSSDTILGCEIYHSMVFRMDKDMLYCFLPGKVIAGRAARKEKIISHKKILCLFTGRSKK